MRPASELDGRPIICGPTIAKCNTRAVLIGSARPSLSESRCRDLALHVAATLEGLMIFIPLAGMRPNKEDEFVRSAKATIWTLLTVDSVPVTDEQPRAAKDDTGRCTV